jgi:hypothetical protein
MRWPQRSHPASVLFSTVGLPSNLWKKRQLKPERLAKVVLAELMRVHKVTEVQLDPVFAGRGRICCLDRSQALYVGASQNLRTQLAQQLDIPRTRDLFAGFGTMAWWTCPLNIT